MPSLRASVSYRSSSLLRAVGGLRVITSLCIQQTAKSQKITSFFWSRELMHLKGNGGSGWGSVGGGVCLSIRIYECTCTTPVNHSCCKADIPIFIKTPCCESVICTPFFQYLEVMLKSRINKNLAHNQVPERSHITMDGLSLPVHY